MGGLKDVFEDFQTIAEILIIIRNKIDLETDVVWTVYDSPQQLIDYLNGYIEKIHAGNSETLSRVYMEFGPTGTYQELSISNGWGNEYVELSKQFDYYHKRIRAVIPAS